ARLGLESELSGALAHLFRRRPQHEPGRVLVDLATALIDGGDCVSDLGALAEQPDLFGAVASPATATRLLYALGELELVAIRETRRRVRERAWALGARPASVTLDFDAQLLECHSEKEGAAPHRTARAASAFTRCIASSTRPASIWPPCCVPATPAPTPPPITSRYSTPPWRSCPRRSETVSASSRPRSSPAPTRPAPHTNSQTRCGSPGSAPR